MVSSLWTTYVATAGWEIKFSNALADSNLAFQINRSELKIYYENHSKRMNFKKQ
jgi:hypothetical protein